MSPEPDPPPDSPGPEEPVPARTWDEAVRRYKRLVYSIAVRFDLRETDADDMFQSTFLTAVRRAAVPPPPSRIEAFLVAVAWREAQHIRRKRFPELREPSEILDLLDEATPSEGVMKDARSVQALADALAALPPRDRRLVEALVLEVPPLSYRRMAAELGISEESVGAARTRALERLRKDFLRRIS